MALAVLSAGMIGCGLSMPMYEAARADRIPTAAPAESSQRREQLDAALARIYRGDCVGAIELLAPLAETADPADADGAEVCFWLGHCRQELGDVDQARPAYQRVLDDWPGSRYAPLAEDRLEEL